MNRVEFENEVNAIRCALRGKVPNCDLICDNAVSRGASLDELRADLYRAAPAVTPVSRPSMDIDSRDAGRYSLSRAIYSAAQNNGRPDGFEGEVSQEWARISNKKPDGFYVPQMLGNSNRAGQLVSSATGAGFHRLRRRLLDSGCESTGQRVWCHNFVDIAVRRPQSFAYCADILTS